VQGSALVISYNTKYRLAQPKPVLTGNYASNYPELWITAYQRNYTLSAESSFLSLSGGRLKETLLAEYLVCQFYANFINTISVSWNDCLPYITK